MPGQDSKGKAKKSSGVQKVGDRRSYVSQTEMPGETLRSALRIAQAIADEFAKQPAPPLLVAQALNVAPTTGPFRMSCGAAIAYGLTEGGYNAANISLTDLGRRIVAPTSEGADLIAKKEALQKPRVIGEFLTKYDGCKMPSDRIARNVLESLGVPAQATDRALKVITKSAEDLKLLREIKGNTYIHLDQTESQKDQTEALQESSADEETTPLSSTNGEDGPSEAPARKGAAAEVMRVFITHGSDREIAAQLKELLQFGNYEPVVEVEHETVSQPVPMKVMEGMRSCQAAIIHVGSEGEMLDEDGEAHNPLNENVLIEIGAAMALYENRFILLVEEGVRLPSNLQGLYQVRYKGGRLDYEATMKLLKAFSGFRKN